MTEDRYKVMDVCERCGHRWTLHGSVLVPTSGCIGWSQERGFCGCPVLANPQNLISRLSPDASYLRVKCFVNTEELAVHEIELAARIANASLDDLGLIMDGLLTNKGKESRLKGLVLLRVKKVLRHGDWLQWLQMHWPKSERHAQLCMAVARGEIHSLHGGNPKRDPLAQRRKQLLNYGLDFESYNEMVREQEGRCAICDSVPSRSLVVDHDHATGAVRGLLCAGCNLALGRIESRPDYLERVAEYLACQSQIRTGAISKVRI